MLFAAIAGRRLYVPFSPELERWTSNDVSLLELSCHWILIWVVVNATALALDGAGRSATDARAAEGVSSMSIEGPTELLPSHPRTNAAEAVRLIETRMDERINASVKPAGPALDRSAYPGIMSL
jgi:hypothetical protein